MWVFVSVCMCACVSEIDIKSSHCSLLNFRTDLSDNAKPLAIARRQQFSSTMTFIQILTSPRQKGKRSTCLSPCLWTLGKFTVLVKINESCELETGSTGHAVFQYYALNLIWRGSGDTTTMFNDHVILVTSFTRITCACLEGCLCVCLCVCVCVWLVVSVCLGVWVWVYVCAGVQSILYTFPFDKVYQLIEWQSISFDLAHLLSQLIKTAINIYIRQWVF